MENVESIIEKFLSVLLAILELFVDFSIQALNLVLEFARAIVETVI